MDIEKRARRQSRRIIISEVLMVLTVIVTVLILAFVVSGYWVGSDFKIERQGLLQIYSIPTGADIEVDGNPSSWLQRTNTSKTLASGKHTIKLTKEKYDSWSRTINITEGLLYRLHYPRLFLQNRTEESAYESSVNMATVSPDRNWMLLTNNTTNWELINLDTENIKPTKLDLSEILPFSSRANGATVGLFTGNIISTEWAADNEHVLLNISGEGKTNWLLLNTKNPASSINLTKEFNADFTKIEILDQSANNLLVVLSGNLHRIDAGAKQISAVLLSGIESFDYYEQNIVFASKDKDSGKYYIGLTKLGSDEIVKLKEDLDAPVRVVITKFYDDEYIGLISENSIDLYLKKDFTEKNHFDLSFNPEKVKVGASGEAIVMSTGGHIATLDMEAQELFEWNTETNTYGWLDSSMIYAVKDSILNVYDFNGLNHRELSKNVSSHFPVTITSDKYLYYFRDGALVREYLFEK
ncbi:PEGA domain-containing protein [Candidatus Saccharibacteria bacterium]|nr:PEGA domain-containing protein [Candidatus Saccharibacteria bacterium]